MAETKPIVKTTVDSIKENVIESIIWDGIKSIVSDSVSNILGTISDVITNAVNAKLYGTDFVYDSVRHHTSRSNTRYSEIYRSKSSPSKPTMTARRTNSTRIPEVEFDHRYEAEEILENMRDILDETDSVSVADYFEMIGEDHTFMDRGYGWDNLKMAYVGKRGSKYVLYLPRVKEI